MKVEIKKSGDIYTVVHTNNDGSGGIQLVGFEHLITYLKLLHTKDLI